jgi:cytochrome bd-type quinol oxidase subunit 2
MNNPSSSFLESHRSKLVLAVSLLVSAIWIAGRSVNVYQFKLTGIFFEMTWLPSILLIFALPLLSLVLWVKDKSKERSLYLYAFIILILSLLYTIVIR